MTRVVLFVALMVVVSGGCKKAFDNLEKQGYESGHPKDGGPGVSVGGGGGGGAGGGVMAVRSRITREEARIAMEQIRLFIDTASSDGTMPSVETTYAALQREAPKYAKMVADRVIVLNPARSRDDVWAYTEVLANNIVVAATASGIEEWTPETLRQRLGR